MGNMRASANFIAIRSDPRVKRRQRTPDGDPTLTCRDHSRCRHKTTRIAYGASMLRTMIRIVVTNVTANDRNRAVWKDVGRELNRSCSDSCGLMSEPDGYCRQRIQCEDEQSCRPEVPDESHTVLLYPPPQLVKGQDNFVPESAGSSTHRRFVHRHAHRLFLQTRRRDRQFERDIFAGFLTR